MWYACKLSGRFDSWLVLRLIFGGKISDSGYKEHNEKTQGYFYTKPVIQWPESLQDVSWKRGKTLSEIIVNILVGICLFRFVFNFTTGSCLKSGYFSSLSKIFPSVLQLSHHVVSIWWTSLLVDFLENILSWEDYICLLFIKYFRSLMTGSNASRVSIYHCLNWIIPGR